MIIVMINDDSSSIARNVLVARMPMAVGTAAASTAEMRNAGMKGRGVSVLHTFMDHLW